MLHVFEHLQLELMLLGTLSLLLTALQDALMKICVKEEGSYGTDECPKARDRCGARRRCIRRIFLYSFWRART